MSEDIKFLENLLIDMREKIQVYHDHDQRYLGGASLMAIDEEFHKALRILEKLKDQ